MDSDVKKHFQFGETAFCTRNRWALKKTHTNKTRTKKQDDVRPPIPPEHGYRIRINIGLPP